jgi:hypothetical protein
VATGGVTRSWGSCWAPSPWKVLVVCVAFVSSGPQLERLEYLTSGVFHVEVTRAVLTFTRRTRVISTNIRRTCTIPANIRADGVLNDHDIIAVPLDQFADVDCAKIRIINGEIDVV